MTGFSAQNIPTLIVEQFLSFPIITTKKCFGRIFTTFPGPGTTGAGKAENRARMTRFCTQNIPILFWEGAKKVGQILTTFPGPGNTSATNVENGGHMTTFGT